MKLNTIGKNERIMHHLIQPRVLAYRQSSRLFGGPTLNPLSWRIRATMKRKWKVSEQTNLSINKLFLTTIKT